MTNGERPGFRPRAGLGVAAGIAISLAMQAGALWIVLANMHLLSADDKGEFWAYLLMLFGAVQWVYLGPAIWIAGRRGHHNARNGLWIVGAATVLLNAAWLGGLLLEIWTNRAHH